MKNEKQDLIRKLAEIRAEMTQINDRSIAENRDLTDEESARWDELRTTATRIEGQIQRAEEIPAADERKGAAMIGLTASETKRYSLLRAIAAAAANDRRLAPFEFECSDAVAKATGRSPRGFFVPQDWMVSQASGVERRALNKTTDSEGGYLVPNILETGSFIDLLRNRMLVRAAGATVLTDLVGEVDIPKQTGGATAYWIDPDSADVTGSTQAVGQVQLRAKTVGAYTDIYRSLLKQASMDAEMFVRTDLATTLALAIDYASLHADGQNNAPTGIAATSGIGLVYAGGAATNGDNANGAAPIWADIVKLETEVAADNADLGRLAYMTNARVRGKLKQTEKASGTAMFVWGDGNTPLNGYAAWVTNQVRSNISKGTSNNLSAIFFGNWSDLIIGQWGVLDVLVNPYALQLRGGVRVSVLQDVDIAVRNAQSFAACLDAATN